MPREFHFCVYMMQSASRRALYIGVTRDLCKRVFQHKMHLLGGLTGHYNAVRLVYWESFSDVEAAIAREKQLKGWRREKKDRLVERMNPEWKDLAADWFKLPESNTATRSLDSGFPRRSKRVGTLPRSG